MADGYGGARTPAEPSVVSGPGALSSRTDGGVMNPNSPNYGEGATLENLRADGGGAFAGAAALPDTSAPVDMLAGAPQFGAESTAPDEAVTSGADLGDGPGFGATGLPSGPLEELAADVKAIGPAAIQVLIAAAGQPEATPSFRRLVRAVLFA